MKNSKPPKIQSNVLGDAGEHIVLSQLLLQGFIAGFAPTNTKDFDLINSKSDGKFLAPIQVKTTMKLQWRMDKKNEVVIDRLIYCFVRINLSDDGDHNSEIFLIDAKTVSKVLTKSHQISLKYPKVNKNQKTGKIEKKIDQNMRVLCPDYNKLSGLTKTKKNLLKEGKDLTKYLSESDMDFLVEYSEGWMKPFRNNWDLLR